MNTNQVNQAFEKWWHSSKYMQVVFSDNRTKRVALDGYEASSQASESEINSLKERVEELQADNNQLREAGQAVVKRWDSPNWSDGTHTRDYIHALGKALSSTHTQSLAEHDNEVIERIATALENAEGEFKTLPEYVSLVRALKVTP